MCWKTRTLVNCAAGRPFAWVDDEITGADRDWLPGQHPGPALLRTINASGGLTDQYFAALDAWLRELPDPQHWTDPHAMLVVIWRSVSTGRCAVPAGAKPGYCFGDALAGAGQASASRRAEISR